MAFRYKGVAWDGQPWTTVPAITTLGKQIEVVRPGTFPGDGTVAGKGHDTGDKNLRSDHTVKPTTGRGVVRAIDFAEVSGFSVDAVLEEIRKSMDERCRYAIHDRNMFSSYAITKSGVYYPPFTWRPYSGSNPHKGHGHLSVVTDSALEKESQPWSIGYTTPIPIEEEEVEAFVTAEQENLNTAGFTDYEGKKLVVDGVLGARTQSAMLKRDQAAADTSAGLSQSEGDARYVRLGQPHTLRKN